MSPPDWTADQGAADHLILRNPELLKPEVYAKVVEERYKEARTGNGGYDNEAQKAKIAELLAQDFPARRTDVHVETSGPQGKVVPLTIIDDPADWKAADWVGREAEYTYHFTPEDITELDEAVEALKKRGLSTEEDIKKLTKADFVLPTLGPKLVELGKKVSHGRGFQFLKGFPVQKYLAAGDHWGLIAAYWGVGLQVGRAQINQTDYNQETGQIEGSILNHIVNTGFKKVEGARHFHQGNALPFHADQGATDLISLMCLSSAKEGGASKWVSSVAIHNELLRRGRKDLVEVLSQPFKIPKRVTQQLTYKSPEGKYEYEEIIPFEYHNGYLSVYFQNLEYFAIQRDGLKLTPLQEEAIWAVITLAERPEFHFKHILQTGDIEWIHNPSIFHSREPYVDGEEESERRHLVRWWIHSDANQRPIPPHYAPRSSINAHGGFKVPPGAPIHLPVRPIGEGYNA